MSFSPRTVVGTLIATALFSSHALAAKGGNAKLTLASSKVTVAGHPASVGSTIAPGETIVTGARSRAEVTLSDGTVARIGQGSSFSFDGSKLTLNQGSALFNLTGKNTKIVTPALTRTGGAGVVSVHASQSYNALFALKGSDTVNGSPLVAGQAWVSESGGPRTFTFDMQKMVGTSTLVTKFPQTPWVAQTTALASVQHQLIAAVKTQPALVSQRPSITTAANGNTVVTVGRTSGTPGFFGKLASAISGKPTTVGGTQGATVQVGGATLLANGQTSRTIGGTLDLGNGSGFVQSGSGSVTLTGGAISAFNSNTISIGNGNLATILAGSNNTAGSTFLISNPNTGGTNLGGVIVNANTVNAGTTGAASGTLVLTGANTYTSATLFDRGIATALTLNQGTNVGTTATIANGVITSAGANRFTGNTSLNAATLNFTTVPAGNLQISPGVNVVFNGTAGPVNLSTLQPGQTATLNGTTFTVDAGTGASGGLLLKPATPAAH